MTSANIVKKEKSMTFGGRFISSPSLKLFPIKEKTAIFAPVGNTALQWGV